MHKLLLIVAVGCSLVSMAQKPFEGKIVYSISYDSVPEPMKGIQSMLADQLTVYAKPGKTRLEQKTAVRGESVLLLEKGKSPRLITTLADRLLDIEMPESVAKHWGYVPDIIGFQWRAETEIVDLQAKSAAIVLQDQLNYTAIFAARWLAPYFYNLQHTDRLPLKYNVAHNGLIMTLTAISVRMEPTDDTYFVAPADAVKIDYATWQSLLR